MRLMASVVVACLVTLFLFFFMQSMISAPVKPPDKPALAAGIALVRIDQVAEIAESKPTRLPRSSQPTLPPPNMPQLSFNDFKAPDLPPPEANMPELALVKPGGMPYLGAYLKPAKVTAPTEVSLKQIVSSKQPKLSKPVEKSKIQAATKSVMSQEPVDLSAPAIIPTAQNGTGEPSGSAAGLPNTSTDRMGLSGELGGITGGSVDEEVIALLKTTPVYPRKAARSKQEGWVKIEFTITAEGLVSEPKVISAKPRRIFDRAALKAIRNWRFKPRTIQGKAVSRRAVQVIEFRLAAG